MYQVKLNQTHPTDEQIPILHQYYFLFYSVITLTFYISICFCKVLVHKLPSCVQIKEKCLSQCHAVSESLSSVFLYIKVEL